MQDKSAVSSPPRDKVVSAQNADEVIEQAIRRGEREGLDALGPVEKVIFAISEAEVYCDMVWYGKTCLVCPSLLGSRYK